ncbi:MAG TPA: NnrS family protein [Thermoanaerobaculia bacterium]|nr:NnrS family protein [Thermoanaerobaculia bacterium]
MRFQTASMTRCRSLSEPHDAGLSRMLIVYIATGLFFMLIPGTLVGVANLLTISASHTPRAADAGWVQAHGHAQIFGWLGTFILGIGYYAIPRLRLAAWSPFAAWTTYALWTAGVTMRWAVGTWPPDQWRVLFPLAGALELLAVLVFCVSVFLARPRARDEKWRTSVVMITAAGWGMFASITIGAWMSFRVDAPLFPFDFNQRYLALITWGFVVPFVWGFATRWLPPLLGLRRTRKPWLLPSLVLLFAGVVAALAGALLLASLVFLASSVAFVVALRLWEPSEREPKLRGVHESTPLFLRIAFVWLAIAALLAIVSAALPLPNGWAGASRHALTVGFFAVVVFSIGPRVLPAFFGVRRLWSARLMAAVLVLVNIGCTLRVVSQVLAYEGLSAIAWQALPLSAVIEMTAVALFALNMMMTLTTGSPLAAFLEAQQQQQGDALSR